MDWEDVDWFDGPLIDDISQARYELPKFSDQSLKPWTIMKAIGGMIGKDLSQTVLPITFHEPFTVLMKPAE